MGGTTYAATEARREAIPLGVIDYDQSSISDWTDRRADCSGLISYVWDLPKTGPGTWLNAYTTQSLWEQGLIVEIDRSELVAGDAIGYCGPDTANGGGGHIALYRANKGTQYHVWDHGSGMGPKDRFVTWDEHSTGWLAPGKCKAWRYVNMGAQEETSMFFAQTKGTVEVYACDGMRRRLVHDQQELADIRELARLGLVTLSNDGQVLMVDRIAACGQIVDQAAAAAPHSHVTGLPVTTVSA